MAEVAEVGSTTVRVRLFGPARSLFGTGQREIAGDSVAEVVGALLEGATAEQAEMVSRCGWWVNGEPAEASTSLRPGDELALLPPVSGGCRWWP